MAHLDIVFDGPPGPEAGRFVEVEDCHGNSVGLGEWVEREDGFWVLRFDRDDVDRAAKENEQFGVGA